MAINPDAVIHVFRTFLGLPPDTTTPPLCGAVLTADYDRGGPRPQCGDCNRLRDAELARRTAGNKRTAGSV